MNFKDILVQAALPMLKAVGGAEVDEILARIKENNTPEVYAETLKGGHSFFKLLNEVAVKTKTKIDDGIIDIFQTSIETAAAADGITL